MAIKTISDAGRLIFIVYIHNTQIGIAFSAGPRSNEQYMDERAQDYLDAWSVSSVPLTPTITVAEAQLPSAAGRAWSWEDFTSIWFWKIGR